MLIREGKRRVKTIWECDICKKHFQVVNIRARESVKKGQKKFCSKECKTEYWKKEASKRVIEYVRNVRHGQFGGGFGITTDGYVWIYIKGKRANQVKLHRYLMEVKLGRKLLPTEIIHHINGDKFDNRIENLQLVSRSEHNRIHKFLHK
jgi:hypothetical protein